MKPRDIVPLSELAADGGECADGPEADRAVQRDTGFVWHRGACVGIAEALCSQFFEELQVAVSYTHLTLPTKRIV